MIPPAPPRQPAPRPALETVTTFDPAAGELAELPAGASPNGITFDRAGNLLDAFLGLPEPVSALRRIQLDIPGRPRPLGP